MLHAANQPAVDSIASLHAVEDCREIALLLSSLEFSWDIERALEFALFRTYAVPSISACWLAPASSSSGRASATTTPS